MMDFWLKSGEIPVEKHGINLYFLPMILTSIPGFDLEA